MRKALFAFITLMVFAAHPGMADELDSASTEALGKTQSLLKSKSERQKYIDQNYAAKAADKKVNALTNDSSTKEDMYNMSSDIFADLVKQTGGDVSKLNELLDQAMKNPEAFYEHLSPAQKEKIRGLASKIQQSNPLASPQK